MNMTSLMNEMIREAQERASESRAGGGGALRQTDHGELHLSLAPANCLNSGRNKQYRKNWTLDGKRIAANKLEAL